MKIIRHLYTTVLEKVLSLCDLHPHIPWFPSYLRYDSLVLEIR